MGRNGCKRAEKGKHNLGLSWPPDNTHIHLQYARLGNSFCFTSLGRVSLRKSVRAK